MEKFAPLNLTPDELIEYTREWKGERFPDGRPKVPDGIIERMKEVTITQAWGVLRGQGYNWQYEDGFLQTHPGQVLVGRALTALYMPRRPQICSRRPKLLSPESGPPGRHPSVASAVSATTRRTTPTPRPWGRDDPELEFSHWLTFCP